LEEFRERHPESDWLGDNDFAPTETFQKEGHPLRLFADNGLWLPDDCEKIKTFCQQLRSEICIPPPPASPEPGSLDVNGARPYPTRVHITRNHYDRSRMESPTRIVMH
jgi:hypothetical protein